MEGYERLLGPNHPRTLTTKTTLGLMLVAQRRLDEAEPILTEALAARRAGLGDRHVDVAYGLEALAKLMLERNDASQAALYDDEAIGIFAGAFPADHPDLATARIHLGRCLTALGRFDDAETELLEALPVLEAKLGADHPAAKTAWEKLIECYEAWAGHEETEGD